MYIKCCKYIPIIYFILVYFGGTSFSHAQFSQIASNPDSIFQKYEKPKIPDSIYYEYTNSVTDFGIVYIAASLGVDDSGIVRMVICNPLYNVANTYSNDDKIWDICSKSIEEASKKWVVRNLLTDDNRFLSSRQLFQKIQGNQITGPQSLLIIFEFYLCHEKYIKRSYFSNNFVISVL